MSDRAQQLNSSHKGVLPAAAFGALNLAHPLIRCISQVPDGSRWVGLLLAAQLATLISSPSLYRQAEVAAQRRQIESRLLPLPVLRPVPDMHDLYEFFADSINDNIGRVTHHPFASTTVRTWATKVRLVGQKLGRVDNPLRHRTGSFRVFLEVVSLGGL